MRFSRTIALVACLWSSIASGTCPIFDTIRYEGLSLTIYKNTDFPQTPQFIAWRRELPGCSALNQGRAEYKVTDGQVHLVGLNACGPKHPPLSKLFPAADAENRLEAKWLNGDIEAYGGRPVCIQMCPIFDTYFKFTMIEGKVLSVSEMPNPDVTQCGRR
jgi:hypothetical protein